METDKSRFDSRKKQRFIFAVSRPVLGATQWVPGALFQEVKRQGCEADHSIPFSPEIKTVLSYTSTPPYVLMAY
jgi:hypothetical protein